MLIIIIKIIKKIFKQYNLYKKTNIKLFIKLLLFNDLKEIFKNNF